MFVQKGAAVLALLAVGAVLPAFSAHAAEVLGGTHCEKPVSEATRALQARIDDVAAKGGGRVTVPAGDHEVGAIWLRSNVDLHLEKGARLLGTRDWRDYRAGSFVNAADATNVAVTGEGAIDVRGQKAWFIRKTTPVRPNALMFNRCVNVRIEDVAISNAASWTVFLARCEGVTIRGIDLFSHANYNNDGIDVCGCRNVLIENSRINSDDDGIVLKAWDADMAVENVEVRNCRVAANCNFLKLGTETKGVFRNIRFHDCVIFPPAPSVAWDWVSRVPGLTSVSNGISAIAVECVDGGQLENVRFSDIDIQGGPQTAIFIRHGARRSVEGRTSHLKDVVIENVKGRIESQIASSITGCAPGEGVRPGIRPRGIVIRNVDLTMPGGCATKDDAPVPEKPAAYPENRMFDRRPLPAYGFYVRHADDITFENVKVRTEKPDVRPACVEDDATGIVTRNCSWR